MKSIVWFVLLVYCVSFILTATISETESKDELWSAFKIKYDKVYSSVEEELFRKRIWYENYLYVQEFKKTKHDFTIDINIFADKTRAEMVNGLNSNIKPVNALKSDLIVTTRAPDSFDWRQRGVISPVIDQGLIPDVLPIVAEECIQSLYAIQTGILANLSVAEIIDCCGNFGDPFQCIYKKFGGLCSQASYPDPVGECNKNKCTPAVMLNGSFAVPQGNEDVMLNTVLFAPLFVGIDASQTSFQLYSTGIYNDPSCTGNIDHALQLVGYGVTSDGTKYWICKNSWGASWGENGYIRVERGKNMCGIADYALLPFKLQ